MTMEKHFGLTDQEFLDQFMSCTLRPADFTHIGHLRLVWINIKMSGTEVAINEIQKQIKRFVEAAGATDKYHTTLTVAAIKTVDHFMAKSNSNTFMEFIIEFPILSSDFKGLLDQHYSSDILSSDLAKYQYVTPDLLSF